MNDLPCPRLFSRIVPQAAQEKIAAAATAVAAEAVVVAIAVQRHIWTARRKGIFRAVAVVVAVVVVLTVVALREGAVCFL